MKETELAQHFIRYLSCYDLYYEIPQLNVDIVANDGNILMAFEVKRNMNFRVIEQAVNNKIYFHYSYICVPYTHNMSMPERICRDYGIGILAVHNVADFIWGDIMEITKPKLNRKAITRTVKLPEFSKHSIAGASGSDGTTITPFKNTVNSIVKYLSKHNGANFKDVYNNIDTHYHNFSAAKSSLYQWIHKGIITEFYFDNGKLYLSNSNNEKRTDTQNTCQTDY